MTTTHQRIGRIEQVARHYTEAGNVGSAFVFWRRAGERASRQLANHEAVDHFGNALGQLAAEARAERAAGRVSDLDPDTL